MQNKTRNISRDVKVCFTIIKWLIELEAITSIKIYTPNNRASHYMKKKVTCLVGKMTTKWLWFEILISSSWFLIEQQDKISISIFKIEVKLSINFTQLIFLKHLFQ